MAYTERNPNGQATMANSEPVVIASNQSAVPVSASALPLPSGAATGAKQDTGNDSLSSIDGKLPAQGQALASASIPVVLPTAQIAILTPPAAITGYATETTLGTRLSESDFDTKTGALTETAPATDIASSGLNGRLQRIAQRISSLISLLPTALGAGGGLKVDGSGTALPVSGTVTANAAVADGADVTIGAKADARSTATDTTAITAMQVLKEISYMEQNPASRDVTNAGTFAVQATASGSGKTLKRAFVALAASGDIVALVSSKRIKVYAYSIQSLTDGMSITIKDSSGGNTIGAWTLNAREGVVGSTTDPPTFIFATTAGNALYGTISGTGTVNVAVSYWDDDAS